MNKNVLLIAATLATILFSCNNNANPKGGKDNVSDAKMSREDSLASAEKLELDQMRQDSIDAINIKEYSVKRLSGKDKYSQTKIEYQSLPELLDETKKTSDKEMWTAEKLQSICSACKVLCKFGKIRLYVERLTIDAANTDMFTIIVKDTSERELYRKELDSKTPDYSSSSSDLWWNFGYAYIDKKIKAPFYVYVVDKLADAPFKFEVTEVRK